MSSIIRKGLVGVWLLLLFSCIGYLFWQQELKYNLPTEEPAGYRQVSRGSIVGVAQKLGLPEGRPVFIHFFNPDCPCSRFNMPHVQSLIGRYGDRISFAVVVLGKQDETSAEAVQAKYDLDVPVVLDSSIAAACGVFSTPQAVLLDEEQHLYYRGNYNKSRYCTDRNSNYAQMAIDSFLNRNISPAFHPFALKAYGCELPACSK